LPPPRGGALGPCPDLLEELGTQRGVLERTAPERRRRSRVLLDAAHLRAEVRGGQVNGDAARLDQLVQRVRDLFAQALLEGEPAREQTHQPSQLRDADDLLS